MNQLAEMMAVKPSQKPSKRSRKVHQVKVAPNASEAPGMDFDELNEVLAYHNLR